MKIRRPQVLFSSGFTLVEAMMSMLVVSVLLVAAMRATASSTLGQYKTAERVTGLLLAGGLINDIHALSYEESASPLFGCEGGESGSSKANYDDVDDFNGWTENPPQERDGTTMVTMTGWQRSVLVERLNPADLSQVLSNETGAKRITVTVRRNGLIVATRSAIRTKAP